MSGLKVYLRSHTDKRSYICQFCEKKFANPQVLTAYKRESRRIILRLPLWNELHKSSSLKKHKNVKGHREDKIKPTAESSV